MSPDATVGPFLIAGFLAIILIARPNWFVLVRGVVVFFLLAARTRTEEEKLVVGFGDDYREYMMRTRRFVPKL